MRTQIALLTSLAALGATLPTAAWAQDAATLPGDAPVAAPANPPVPAEPSAPVEAAPGEAAPGETAPAEAAPAGPAPMPGWMRIDSDLGGLQLWGGGTYPIADGFGLAFDMYVTSGYLGELDVGPAITAGPVTITPMIGVQMDWQAHKAAALVPQLYVVGGGGPVYGELWLQYYNYKVFDYAPSNQLYARLFVDFKLNDYIAIGPELDLIHDSEADLASLAIGPNVMLSNVGAGSSFIAFVGYETQDTFGEPDDMGVISEDSANHLAGRLTFVHNF